MGIQQKQTAQSELKHLPIYVSAATFRSEIEIDVSRSVCSVCSFAARRVAHIDDEKAEKLFLSIRFTLESENKIQKNNKRPKVNSH